MPYNSWAEGVRLLAEQYETKSNVKLDGFQSQLRAPYVSSHNEELWYNKTVSVDENIYIYISSSCLAISMDIPDPLSPHLPIIHCFWQILRATSCIGTELLYVGLNWMSCLCSFMWRGPQEYITHKLVPTSPALSHVSGSSNFDSFRDGW